MSSVNEKPMTLKTMREYLKKQLLVLDRNWVTEYCTVYDRIGNLVTQGPRSEIEARIRAGEEF